MPTAHQIAEEEDKQSSATAIYREDAIHYCFPCSVINSREIEGFPPVVFSERARYCSERAGGVGRVVLVFPSRVGGRSPVIVDILLTPMSRERGGASSLLATLWRLRMDLFPRRLPASCIRISTREKGVREEGGSEERGGRGDDLSSSRSDDRK